MGAEMVAFVVVMVVGLVFGGCGILPAWREIFLVVAMGRNAVGDHDSGHQSEDELMQDITHGCKGNNILEFPPNVRLPLPGYICFCIPMATGR